MRILLVKRDKIGDLLLTTPILSHLRSVLPDAAIHLLANDYNAWVVQGQPHIDRLWVYPRVRHGGRLRVGAALRQVPLALALRRARFDWAIAMNGEESPRAVARAMSVGAKATVAYAADPRRYGRRLTHAVAEPGEGHEIDRMARLLEPLGVSPPTRWCAPTCSIAQEDALAARRFLDRRRIAPQGFILLGLGARWPQKQPTASQVVRWSSAWHERWALPTVLSWTPGERDNALYPGDDAIATEVLRHGLAHVHPYIGTVGEVAALVHAARTTLVPDSGLMHVAAASPGGVLGLFALEGGYDDPTRWHPVGPGGRCLVSPGRVADLADEDVHAQVAALVHARSPKGF